MRVFVMFLAIFHCQWLFGLLDMAGSWGSLVAHAWLPRTTMQLSELDVGLKALSMQITSRHIDRRCQQQVGYDLVWYDFFLRSPAIFMQPVQGVFFCK